MSELEIPDSMHIEDKEEEQTERELTPRELAMQAIAEKAERVRQDQIAQGVIYDEEAKAAGLTFAEDDEPTEKEKEEEKEEEVREAEEPTETKPESKMVSVTFEGRSFDVTPEQYAELAQMGMLANTALHHYVRENQGQQPQQQPPQAQPQPQSRQGQVIDPDLIRECVRRIQYGGEEDGAEALTRLIVDVTQRSAQPTINPDAIVQQAAAVAQAQAQFHTDAAIIQREYKDIFADEQRTMLARLNVDAIRQRNAAMGKYQSDLDTYREAGDRVLDALKLPRPTRETETKQQPAIQAVPSSNAVIERKRAAPKPTRIIDQRAPVPPTQRMPSGTDIVEQMRRARGQASMM